MTLTELRYITAVARHRHFGRAAEACFVSQPTLSVAVKKLEEELDVTLFERNRGEVLVTSIGELVVTQARETLASAERIRELAAAGRDQLARPLNLGAIYTIGPYLIPQLLPGLRRRAPAMQLIIQEGLTDELLDALHTGELDLLLLSPPIKAAHVEIDVVYTEPFVVAVPADHEWVRREAIEAGELARQTLLLLGAGNCFRDQVLDACPACRSGAGIDHELQRTLEGGSLETIRQMVAAGTGITVLPALSVEGETAMNGLLAIRPFTEPAPSREVALVWRGGFPRTEAVTAVRRAIEEAGLPHVRLQPPAPRRAT